MSRLIIRARYLPWTASANKLQQYFSLYGRVTRVKVDFDEKTGMSRRHAYIEFDREGPMTEILFSRRHELDLMRFEIEKVD